MFFRSDLSSSGQDDTETAKEKEVEEEVYSEDAPVKSDETVSKVKILFISQVPVFQSCTLKNMLVLKSFNALAVPSDVHSNADRNRNAQHSNKHPMGFNCLV